MHIYFKPLQKSLPTILLTMEHKRLWRKHAPAIEAAFLETTGAPFKSSIRAIVGIREEDITDYQDWSHSGLPMSEAMALYYTSSAPGETAILNQICHEVGHRLLQQYGKDVYLLGHDMDALEKLYESHRQLYVFLIDVLNKAFDENTARHILEYMERNYSDPKEGDESGKRYEQAWQWAASLPAVKRRELTRAIFQNKHANLDSWFKQLL